MNTATSVKQDDINAGSIPPVPIDTLLSENEIDTLGEIGNICMGTSATTLSTLLSKRVVITTPKISICKGTEYLQEYEKPVVSTQVSYTEGLDGNNVFVLKKEDSLLITQLLMGGGQSEEELNELYLSAMSEVMNQMVGSSSTALANILNVRVDISPPEIKEFSKEDHVIETMFGDETFILIKFKMEIEDLLTSNIMQIMPIEFGKKLAASLCGEDTSDSNEQQNNERLQANTAAIQQEKMVSEVQNTDVMRTEVKSIKEEKPVELKTAKFQSFGNYKDEMSTNVPKQNIDLIIDVPLQVTVMLGKSRKSIKEILEMGMGSVVVLDKLAGEMVDVLVNGKIFARGEVVVIDDNYGIRITEMTSGQIKM